MGVLNLRDVPEELMRELRAQAALEGSQFHPFCKALLSEAISQRRGLVPRPTLPPDHGAVFGGEFNMLDHIDRGILQPMPQRTPATPTPEPPEVPPQEIEIT